MGPRFTALENGGDYQDRDGHVDQVADRQPIVRASTLTEKYMPREQKLKRKRRVENGRHPLAPETLLTLGSSIRRHRRNKGWSREELAARAGITPNYLGSLEIGGRHRSPSFGVILVIADALGVEMCELIGLRVKKLDPIGVEAACLVQAMPESAQAIVLKLLRVMVRERPSERRVRDITKSPL